MVEETVYILFILEASCYTNYQPCMHRAQLQGHLDIQSLSSVCQSIIFPIFFRVTFLLPFQLQCPVSLLPTMLQRYLPNSQCNLPHHQVKVSVLDYFNLSFFWVRILTSYIKHYERNKKMMRKPSSQIRPRSVNPARQIKNQKIEAEIETIEILGFFRLTNTNLIYRNKHL